MAYTHFQKFGGLLRQATTHPTGKEQQNGAMYYDSNDHAIYVYYGGIWRGILVTTSTSTSTTTSTTTT